MNDGVVVEPGLREGGRGGLMAAVLWGVTQPNL